MYSKTMAAMLTFRTWPLVGSTFVAIAALSLLVTVLTVNSITSLRNSILEVNERHRERSDRLDALRSEIYISSILVRDLLLDEVADRPAAYRARLLDSHRSAVRHLAELDRLFAGRIPVLRSLADELHAYWQSVETLVRDTDVGLQGRGYAYVRSQILPRRYAVIALAEELADISAADAQARRDALNASITKFQTYTVWLRTGATAIAILVGLLTTVRVYRIERSAMVEHRRVEGAEAEMRKLSQQLVNAQEQERRSLSRELHDHIGQMMTALRFGLSDLEQHCPVQTAPFSSALQNCRAILEGTIEAIRGIAMGLRPSMLDDLGLAAAIEWHAREFSRQFNIPVEVDVRAAGDCPEPQRTALYRVAQEALTNCARHAQAKSVKLDLRREPDSLRLSVSDDGTGMPAHDNRRGFGLMGMEERAREVGGQLQIHSTPGGGTTVAVRVPVPEDQANAKNHSSYS